MVPLAAAGWGAAWVGTWGAPAGIAAAAAGVALALTVAALRRSAMVLTIALVMRWSWVRESLMCTGSVMDQSRCWQQ